MDAQVSSKSLTALMNEHLRLPNETLQEFSAQLKKLTPQDKADLTAAFEAQGFVIRPA